jgi:hypothetical protein
MAERLEQAIERFLRTGTGDFDSLALEVFHHQFEKNAPYRAFCQAQRKSPKEVLRWQDIPAVPVVGFKSSELATFPTERAAAVFHSSGTTLQTSRHFLRTLDYYEAALKWGAERYLFPDNARLPLLLMAPPPGEKPHSSLTWMLEVIKRIWGEPGSQYFIQRGRVDDWNAIKFLQTHQAAGRPVALLGTTLGFLELFDVFAKRQLAFRCAPGSRIMDTGGMKTATREVTREAFVALVDACLEIPEAQCINEYGMSEMSSQFYARGVSTTFEAPPWVRTLVVDPENGTEMKAGQIGVLRHFDLANVDSVMALQTEDSGVMTPVGFQFMGRAVSATVKGCSIDLENYLRNS